MSENTEPKILHDDKDATKQVSIMSHIAELRTRLVYCILCLVAVFLMLAAISQKLYKMVAYPLTKLLPPQASIIATDITAGFLAPIRLSFFVALFVCMPFILAQIWAFVRPALYRHEKRIALPLLLMAIALFYIGAAFAYFLVLAPALQFFLLFTPENVLPMTDIDSYLGFVMKLLLVFGVMFEIPVLVLLLCLIGLVSPKTLAKQRRYIIVACFFVAAIITPPDGASMVMLAVPMCLLFECGLLFARMLGKSAQNT